MPDIISGLYTISKMFHVDTVIRASSRWGAMQKKKGRHPPPKLSQGEKLNAHFRTRPSVAAVERTEAKFLPGCKRSD